MFHPVLVIPIGVILAGMGSTTFLAVFGAVHCSGSTGEQVFQFKRFNQVRVPDQRLVRDANVVKLFHNCVNHTHTCTKDFTSAINRCMFLHPVLHIGTDFCGRNFSLGVSELVEFLKGLHAGISGEIRDLVTRLGRFGNAKGTGSTKYNNVEQRVRSEAVCPVNRRTSSFASCKETGNDYVLRKVTIFVKLGPNDFPVVVGGDTSHVVVHSWEYGDGFFGDVL